jgi:hypothetical protein
MAKVTGLGATVTVDNASGTPEDISTDVSDYQFSTPYGVQDTTGVNKSAHERLLLLQDFSLTLNGVFDPGASLAHVVLSGDKRVSRTVAIINETTSSSTMTAETLFTDYQIKRSNAGELTWSAPGVLANGVAPAWT